MPNGWWYMPPEPVPADPGWDEDLAWLDRDPMTAEEFEASLDRLCELDEPPGEEDYGEFEPFTDPCDHRHENSGHDAGVKLRHLSQIRHATCTSPVCRAARRPVRPGAQHPVRSRRTHLPV